MKYPDGRWPCEAEGIYGGGVVRSQNLIYDEACHFMGGAVYMYMDICVPMLETRRLSTVWVWR
jgi:hypothetical protein